MRGDLVVTRKPDTCEIAIDGLEGATLELDHDSACALARNLTKLYPEVSTMHEHDEPMRRAV